MHFFSSPFLASFTARLVYFSCAIFIYFGSPPFALLSATHVFPIPLNSWELIPLWVVCKRAVGLVLVPDYLFIYLFLILPGYVFYLAVLCRDLVLVFLICFNSGHRCLTIGNLINELK